MQEISSDIQIFPSPTFGILNMEFTELKEREIQILDIAGRVLKTLTSNTHSFQFDMSRYTSGIYHVKVSPENIIYPIIKQ